VTGTEEWRHVAGWEGWYEISDLGRVRRVRASQGTVAGRVLKASPGSGGYLTVRLSGDGRQKTYMVHLLVADAFLGARPLGFEVDHVDGIKANCRLQNLEVVTPKENTRRALALGLRRSGALGEMRAQMRGAA
jgi:hypothetical protein